MTIDEIHVGSVVTGPLLPEPVEVLAVVPLGDSIKLIGKGCKTGLVRDPVLTPAQLAQLRCSPVHESFDGDPALFRLGIEAHRLGLAYEYDPFFSLSIARVDPLPHQLEAVYDYFLKLPRIRFLLADDPGAGKTIMAGLLLKELKARGLVRRTLVVAPANLTFQWQRELKDKFRENFEVIRGETLRTTYGQNPWQDRDQVVTSISWVSRIEDAKESLLRSHWDLVIVDEAHKMSAYADDKKTLAYRLGESLSDMTDHYLLMTATPHKGDPENFCRFLALLDRDVYGNVKSLEDAMRRGSAAVLPPAHQGGPGQFPRPGDRRGQEALHQARGQDLHLRAERGGVRLLRRPDDVRRGPVDPGFGRRLGGRPGRRLHHGDASAPDGLQRLRRASVAGTHEGASRGDPGGSRSLPPQADRTPHPR